MSWAKKSRVQLTLTTLRNKLPVKCRQEWNRKNSIVFFNIVELTGNIKDNVRPQERASVFENCRHLGVDIESDDLINC